MAGWSGSGTFSRIYSWVADSAAGINITASRMDDDTNNITTNGFNNCLTRDGQGSATANQPMNGFKHTGVGNAVADTDYIALGQLKSASGAFALGINFANLGDIKQSALPAGFVPTLAPGWHICDGSTRPRTDPLFVSLGIGSWAFGPGNGTTTYTLPDFRGRVPIGVDASGANRVTSAGSGIDSNTIGASGGNQAAQQHTHTVNDPTHTHSVGDPGHTHNITDPGHQHQNTVTASPGASTAIALNTSATIGSGQITASSVTGVTNQSTTTGVTNFPNSTGITNADFGTGASQNMPPALVVSYLIFTGA